MENQTHQPDRPYPQQPYSPVPNQPQPTYQNQPTHQPQYQYQPQQQYQPQHSYPPAPQKKSHGISIASFILSGFAFLFLISVLNNMHKMNTGVQGGGDAAAFGLFLFYFPLVFISTGLAITDLAVNKTKTALIALLAAVGPAVLFVLYFLTLL